MADPKFLVKQDKTGGWRWTLKATNGEPLGRSEEPFSSKASCLKSIEAVAKAAENAVVVVEE
ncbi:MAG: YegP family protein [Patescibacteria group bacterium]|nr:YegP family protein [Patescibacteria group bacterium]